MSYLPDWLPPERALDLVTDLQRGPGPSDVRQLVFELSSAVLGGKVRARRGGKELTADEVRSLARPTTSRRGWRGCLPEAIELYADDIRRVWGTTAKTGDLSAESRHEGSRAAVSMPDWRDCKLPTKKRIDVWVQATIAAGWDTAQDDWFRKCEDAINPDGAAAGFSERLFISVWKQRATPQMLRKGPRPRPGHCPPIS